MQEKIVDRRNPIPKMQKLIAIFWPSFLVAGVETVLFFTMFDPDRIFYDYNITRLGAYSVGFFVFWLFAILPCLLTLYFSKPCRPCMFTPPKN
jgi:hypothetical protein